MARKVQRRKTVPELLIFREGKHRSAFIERELLSPGKRLFMGWGRVRASPLSTEQELISALFYEECEERSCGWFTALGAINGALCLLIRGGGRCRGRLKRAREHFKGSCRMCSLLFKGSLNRCRKR